MKNAFVIVTLSSLLTACALPPAQTPAAPAGPAAVAPEAATPAAAAPAQEDTPLPKVEMTSTMMYQLTKAEMEFRQGDWQGPYLTMLSLAQQTRDPRLARRAAEMAVAGKQADDALAAIRLWRQLDPRSDEATQYYVGLVIMSDNIADAEPILQQKLAAASAPGERAAVLFQTQQLLLRARDKEAALAMLDRLVAPYAATLEGHIVLAQSALARDDKALAEREARAALAARPDSELAILVLAQVQDSETKVEQLLGKFVAAHPKAREVRAARARLLANQRRFDAARHEFEVLLKDQPDNPAVLYALGILSTQLQDNAAAERYLTRFVDVLGNSQEEERDPSRALLILSQLAEDRQDLNAAQEWVDRIESDDPKVQLSAALRRAQLQGRRGDVEGARKLLQALQPADPAAQAQVVLAEAQLLRDANRVLEAFQHMQEAAPRFQNNPDFLYDYALMAEKAGQVEVMETALRQVMAQAPDNHHAYNALGYSLAERNVRLQEAFELIDKALKMAPGDPFIMDSMGWVQYRLGNLKEAERHLRDAYALRGDPEIAVHLGEVLWQQGRKSDAQKLLREAKAKDPQNDTLREMLARLNLSL